MTSFPSTRRLTLDCFQIDDLPTILIKRTGYKYRAGNHYNTLSVVYITISSPLLSCLPYSVPPPTFPDTCLHLIWFINAFPAQNSAGIKGQLSATAMLLFQPPP